MPAIKTMPSYENRPPTSKASSTKASSTNRSIGAKSSNLTLNTSIYGIGGLQPGYPKLEPKTPPRTPKGSKSRTSTMTKTEGRRLASQHASPTSRETFLDDITPTVEARSNGGYKDGERHSHDLSIGPEQGTRDSLVENMLFSLNGSEGVFGGLGNMSVDEARLYSSFADDLGMAEYRSGNYRSRPGTNDKHVRGVHGHSLSSSDYNEEGRSSSQYTRTRERRSVSSGAFTMTNGKGTSMAQQSVGGNNTLPRAKGKGGSNGSGGSFDLGYAQVTNNNQRWVQGYAGGRRRSSSMEGYGHDTVLANLARQQAAQKDLEPYDTYEAAPTPTVPREPRRMDTATGRPESPMYLHSPVEKVGRKRSVSNRNGPTRDGQGYGKRAETSDGPSQRGGNIPGQNRRLPPLPAFKQDSQHSKKNMPPPAPSQPKQEKPGFFRRVFGSTRNLNAALKDASEINPGTPNVITNSRENTPKPEPRPEPSGRNTSYRSTTSHGHPAPIPSPQPQMTAKEAYHSTQQTLKKTPSSFFRRRKKSVSEMAPPPMPLPPRTLDFDSLARLNSPTGSLMGAMKPYMDSPTRPSGLHPGYGDSGRYVSDSVDTEEERESVRGFSPEWNPDKNATIRSVDSPRRDISQAFPKSALGVDGVTDEDLDRSFLHESSDSELQIPIADKGRVVSQTMTLKPEPSREGASSPALSNLSKQESKTARDMQMVQEYNDKYAKRQTPVRKNTGQSLSLYPTNSNSIGSPQSARSSQREVDDIVERLEAGEELGDLEPDEVVIVTPKREDKKPERVRLEPTLSEENMAKQRLGKIDTTMASRDRTGAIESSQSTPNVWYSATELPLNGGADSVAQTLLSPVPPTINLHNENENPDASKSGERAVGEPTTEDKDRAKKIYDGNEDFILKSKAAAWIGEDSPARSRTLHAYMSLYDFKDMNILTALRALCNRLVLRAESQQVDRILVEFSKRWCTCNENHGFRSWDVVHTICYSLLLLNTDLHVADIEKKMTRDQFTKNALPTVMSVVEEAEGKAADTKESKRPSIMIDTFKEPEGEATTDKKEEAGARGNSLEIAGGEKTSWRNSLRPGATRTNSDGPGTFTPLQYSTGGDDCGPLVKAPFLGNLKTWELQVEIVLKDFYNAIKAESLPLFDAENQNRPAPLSNRSQQGHSTLSVFGTGMLRRTPSAISRAGSESGYVRGRTAEAARLNTGKWSTKNGRNRSRVGGGGSVYPSSLMGGSRTSLDDNSSSIWSPSGLSFGTSGWGGSKYSLGKTHTSLSVNSFGSGGDGDYHQSIGFANALSNAIIKEEYPQSRDGADSRSIMSGRTTGMDSMKGAKLLDDESLELEGAPWGKEGILKHKWHLDVEGKRSKERSWNEVFAVINQGYMSLFSFSSASSKSQRIKSKSKGRVTVGGGNWQDNAESLGQFVLRQTIASALPTPGYSKQRPYVFALSLPTGAVHLFQVGTETIIKEWVMTANYWSARLSNHPLVGGISNIEYGWSDAVINTSAMAAINEAPSDGVSRPPVSGSNSDSRSPPRTSISGARPSLQSSLRSSLDHASGGSFRPKLPADKITIHDWTPPTQSMRASTLSEDEQLAYLTDYVSGVEEELGFHQVVRGGMALAFSKSSPNAVKATNNWEKKSSYLLREIVKFRTYIDTLEAARRRREEVYEERRETEVLREEHGN